MPVVWPRSGVYPSGTAAGFPLLWGEGCPFPVAGTMPSPWSWLEQDVPHHSLAPGHLLEGSDTFLGP